MYIYIQFISLSQVIYCDSINLGEDAVEVTKEVTINVSKIASALEESGKTGKQVEIVY